MSTTTLERLRAEVAKRMRVRHTFNAWVRKQFVESMNPRQLSTDLIDIWRNLENPKMMRERIADAVAELARVQSIADAVARVQSLHETSLAWHTELKELVTLMRTPQMQQYMRRRVEHAGKVRADVAWLDVAAAMPHEDDAPIWRVLLARPATTVAAYTALAVTPNAALRYLHKHLEALPGDQRAMRISATVEYLVSQVGTLQAREHIRGLLAGTPITLTMALSALDERVRTVLPAGHLRVVHLLHRLLRREVPLDRLERLIDELPEGPPPNEEAFASTAYALADRLLQTSK